MPSRSFTIFLVCIRVITGLVSAASLVLYAIILAKVFDDQFPAIAPWMTALPIFPLGISIIYNTLIIFLIKHSLRFSLTSDLIIAALLVTLGATGFVFDNVHYLDNGLWRQYDEGPWLTQEIWAGSLLIASVVLHVFLAFMSYWGRSTSKTESDINEVVESPTYYQSQADFYQEEEEEEASSESGKFMSVKFSFEKGNENGNEEVKDVEKV